ncbi:MAG: PEP-CTERM sorting domain-containing protein [Phycisphaerae bacterium]|jgi:hypothetical protein
MKKCLGVLMLCIFLLTLGSTASASTRTWIATSPGDWSVAANWNGTLTTADTARIITGDVTLDSSQTVSVVQMGNTSGPASNCTLNINSGADLTVACVATTTEVFGLARYYGSGSAVTVNHSAGTVKVSNTAGTGELRFITGSSVTGATVNYNLSGTGVIDTEIFSRGVKLVGTINFNATSGTALIVRNKINKFGKISEGGGFNQSQAKLEIGAVDTIAAITVGDGSNSMDYTVGTGGTLAIDIASASSYDTVLQYGDICNTAGATLSIDLLGGYTPELGSFFDIWKLNDLSKMGSGIFAVVPAGFSVAWVDTGSTVEGVTTSDLDGITDTLRVTVIPEPTTIALLGLGLLAVRRNKK